MGKHVGPATIRDMSRSVVATCPHGHAVAVAEKRTIAADNLIAKVSWGWTVTCGGYVRPEDRCAEWPECQHDDPIRTRPREEGPDAENSG